MFPSSPIWTKFILVSQIVFGLCVLASDWSDDEHSHHHQQHHQVKDYGGHPPKDRILLKDTKTLVFQRNKRTTHKRTHPIHQLSCVGGTAGCKLFTPDIVECENAGFNDKEGKINWRCLAEIGDRVTFNHVEVICEGYDYPEDDYILVGSCGLEFTLDYKDPLDHHEKSYYKHMDEHEKEMHQKIVGKPSKPKQAMEFQRYLNLFNMVIESIASNVLILGIFVMLVICSLVLVRWFSSRDGKKTLVGNKGPGYGPLTSAVLTTKKIT